MTGLQDYEAWLDTLDHKLFVDGDVIRSNFDHAISIPLVECTDIRGLKLSAAELRGALRLNRSHVPIKYLLERFLRLAIIANRLPVASDDIMQELGREWKIKNAFTDY